MPASVKILGAEDDAHSFDERDTFALDVLVGLSAARKSIPSKYFYDEQGSELFRRITRLPEYYLTECELETLESHWDRIAACVAGKPFNLVELGPGFSQKTTLFLERFTKSGLDFQYVPIDISASSMGALVGAVEARFPDLNTQGLVGEYFRGLKWLNHRYRRRNLVLFLGSSIGNFTRAESCFFLRSAWKCLNHDDLMLIGFDLKKDIDVLLRAYNDSPGLTSRFNLHLLERINRELGGCFDIAKFRHFGTYDVFSSSMESYLVSQERQSVFIERIGRSFAFEAWEPIHTEHSCKYALSDIEWLAREVGFKIRDHLFDSCHFFTDSIWSVDKPESVRQGAEGEAVALSLSSDSRF